MSRLSVRRHLSAVFKLHGTGAPRAFSLVELAVVVTVMAALAASAVPTFGAWRSATQDRAAAEVVRNIALRAQNQAVAGEGAFLAEEVDEVVVTTAPDTGAASQGISALTDFDPITAPSFAYGQVSTSPLAGGQELGLAMVALSGNCVMGFTDLRGTPQVEVLGDLGDGCHGLFAGCIQSGNCTAQDPGPPGPPELCPTGGSCVAGDEEVTLGWNAPPDDDIDFYEVYIRPNEPGNNPACLHTAGPGTRVGGDVAPTTLDVEDLDNNTRYCFWVVTVDRTGQRSDPSNGVVLTPSDQTPPTAPTLSGTALVRSARLEWTAAVDDSLAGYRLYRSTQNTAGEPAEGTFQLLTTINGPATTYTDTGTAPLGLTPAVRYWYKVEAFDTNANTSPRSNAASVVPLSGTLAPPVVTATGAIKRVFLTWTAGPDPFNERTGYTVSRDGVQVATLPANATSYVDTATATLVDATAYTYTVVATGNLTQSGPAQVSATTIAAPSGLSATAGQNTATASWAARNGAQEYELEASTPVSTSTTAATSLTESALANSVTRTYRVRACASYPTAPAPQRVCTDYTPQVSATTLPGAPTLAATSGQANQIPLTWAAAANTATADTSYELQRRNSPSGAWTTQTPNPAAGTTSRTQTEAGDGIADGTAYDYRIRAQGPGGLGPWSNTVTAASMARPSSPAVTNLRCPQGWINTTFWGGPTNNCTVSVAAGTGPGAISTTGSVVQEKHLFGVTEVYRANFAAPGNWVATNVRQVALDNNPSGTYARARSCNQAGCSPDAQAFSPSVPRPIPWGSSTNVNGVWIGSASGMTPQKTYCFVFHCEFSLTSQYTFPGFQVQILFGNYGPPGSGWSVFCNNCWAYSYGNWVGGVTQAPRTGPGVLPFFVTPRTLDVPCDEINGCTLKVGIPAGAGIWASPGSWSEVFGTDGWCRPGPEVAEVGPGPQSCGYGPSAS